MPARELGRRALLLAAAAAVSGCASGVGGDPPLPDPVDMGPFPSGSLTTAELLPYGATYEFEDGRRHVLQRRECTPVRLATGAVSFGDPAFLRYEEPVHVAVLPAGTHALEVGFFDFPRPGEPGERIQRAAVMAVGATARVRRWRPAEVGGRPFFFGVDAGTGLVYDSGAFDALVVHIEADDSLFETVMRDLVAPLAVGGAVAATAFDCGMGDGGYPVYVGRDASGRAVAVAADLELHHHAKRV
jgi:hypothetical protein